MSTHRTRPWIKARASANDTDCIEQRRHGGVIEVRDAEDGGTGPVLRIRPPRVRGLARRHRQGRL